MQAFNEDVTLAQRSFLEYESTLLIKSRNHYYRTFLFITYLIKKIFGSLLL